MIRDSSISNLVGTIKGAWYIGKARLLSNSLTLAREYALPDKSGTFAMLSDVAGAGGGVVGYEHIQSSPATIWTINHNLSRKVGVSVFSVGGVEIIAEVVNVSINQVQVLFDAANSGYAILI